MPKNCQPHVCIMMLGSQNASERDLGKKHAWVKASRVEYSSFSWAQSDMKICHPQRTHYRHTMPVHGIDLRRADCLPVCMSACLPVRLSVCLFVLICIYSCMSACLPACPSACLSVAILARMQTRIQTRAGTLERVDLLSRELHAGIRSYVRARTCRCIYVHACKHLILSI